MPICWEEIKTWGLNNMGLLCGRKTQIFIFIQSEGYRRLFGPAWGKNYHHVSRLKVI